MQLDLKKQITIILSGSLLLVLVLGFIFIFFFLKGIKQTSADLVETKKELALSQNKLSGAEDLKENYQKIEPDLARIENSFVNPEVPVDLIKFWEETALDSELYINIVPVSSSSDDKDKKYVWDHMTFRLSLFGSFSDLLKFLEKIEAGTYLTEIKDLSVQKLSSSDLASKEYLNLSANDIKAVLTLKVFTASQ